MTRAATGTTIATTTGIPGLREVYVYECDGRYFRESD